MRILNLGSLNIDKVYSVPHFVSAGETILSGQMETFTGGKGLNQSVAIARAGGEVYHAGAIGTDGKMLSDLLESAGVHLDYLQTLDTVSGHAVIQLNPAGQNCIIVCSGSNGLLTESYIDTVLEDFGPDDILLVQNETNCVAYALREAKNRGMRTAFNASPIDDKILSYPLDKVDYFIINEVEGKALSNCSFDDYEDVLTALRGRFPNAAIVLTVGKDGVLYEDSAVRASHGIYDVPVVDTTAAGDTFCGFFLASLSRGLPVEECLRMASLASSQKKKKKGAANSIPTWDDVISFGESEREKVLY